VSPPPSVPPEGSLALGELLARRRELVGFVRSRVESDTVAEEIVQAAFLRGVEHAQDVRDEESSVAWFYRLLRNAIVDHYRRRDAKARALERVAAERPSSPEQVAADDRARACACVRDLARSLKPEYASILEQVDVEERSVSEVAVAEGLTANNATVRLHRARKALRERVMATCRACAEHGCVDCTCKH
jgi:RNA polymerase sigma-70 factor (ECF subfamily)